MRGFSRRQVIQTVAGASLLPLRQAAAAEPIDEKGFQKVGGIDQWIAVQGQDRANPIILFLHGGPGEAQSPFLAQFKPWLRDFTVINWDQRGAGKTYGRNGNTTPDMSLDRMVDDACDVAAYVCLLLSQKKVILVGQSWGSFLGVHAVKRRPELFHAYVGTGQVVDIASTILDLARFARQKAAETGDQATLTALDKAATLRDPARLGALRRASSKYAMSASDMAYTKMMDDYRGHPPYPKGDVSDWMEGARFSGSTVGSSLTSMDIRALGLDMPIPFFIVQGRDDHLTGLEPARAYAEELRAPKKAFVPIDGGHYACFTNPDAFVGALRKYVRPLTI